MSDYTRIAYAPSSSHIHVWEVQSDGEKEHLFACDEVCDGDHCVGPDDISSERSVTVADVEVERKGDTVVVNLVDVVSEPSV
jgi:hypothetical protein